MMISANYVNGLELRIRELTAERNELIQRNAELVAQVSRMQTFIRLAAEKWKDYPALEPTFLNLLRIANQQPEEALRQIQAEAVEDAVTYLAESIPDKSHESVIFRDGYVYISTRYLREYANRIKAGEV